MKDRFRATVAAANDGDRLCLAIATSPGGGSDTPGGGKAVKVWTTLSLATPQ
jgi:hypothetical protein